MCAFYDYRYRPAPNGCKVARKYRVRYPSRMSASATVALEARNLVKEYPGVMAVDGVSFEVAEGTCFGLLGPNGAGKTTTVEIIEGVTRATSGEVYYYGEIAGARFRQETGIQFQNTALQDHITVRETLEMFHALYERQADLEHVIEQCSLGDLLGRDNRKLSGGQRQRLLLAVALVNRPKLVFLDEPTTGLDPQARRNFWALVQSIREEGATIVLTTHYMDEAQVLCDEIVIMDEGKIVTRGTPDDLLFDRYGDTLINLPHGEIRRPNLEDLFLDLTGHSLRA